MPDATAGTPRLVRFCKPRTHRACARPPALPIDAPPAHDTRKWPILIHIKAAPASRVQSEFQAPQTDRNQDPMVPTHSDAELGGHTRRARGIPDPHRRTVLLIQALRCGRDPSSALQPELAAPALCFTNPDARLTKRRPTSRRSMRIVSASEVSRREVPPATADRLIRRRNALPMCNRC